MTSELHVPAAFEQGDLFAITYSILLRLVIDIHPLVLQPQKPPLDLSLTCMLLPDV